MNQKRLFSIFSLGFVSFLVFTLTFSACKDELTKVANKTPVMGDYIISELTHIYDDNPKPVTITPRAGKSPGVVTVLYDRSRNIPINVGAYTVTFNVAAARGWNAASGLRAGILIINSQGDPTPVAEDYDIGGLDQTYDGSPKFVIIMPKDGKSTGARTIFYNGSAAPPVEPGTYTVTFDVMAVPDWNAVNGLQAGTLTIASNVDSRVKYKIYSDGTLSDDYTITVWGNGETFQESTASGGGHTGTRAMRLQDEGAWSSKGRGLTIRASDTTAVEWSTVNALSFWVKGANLRVNSFGFLDNQGSGEDPLNVEYKGDNKDGIEITDAWKNILIPIPAGTAKGTAIARTEVFKVWLQGEDQNNKAVYIDDIELVSVSKTLTAITIPSTKDNVSAGTISIASLLGNYKAQYTVDGKQLSLINKTAPNDGNGTIIFANWFNITYNVGGAAVLSGENNITATGNFTLTVTFDGKTSNQLSVTVAQAQTVDQTPKASDYNISGTGSVAWNGSAKTVTVEPKSGSSSGARTVRYNGSTTAPSAVGTYTVTFDVAAATGWNGVSGLSAGTLTITGQTPVAGDYTIGGLNQIFDGSTKSVTITAKSGKSSGIINILYNGSGTVPSAVGNYTVTFNVAAAAGWNAASGLSAGTLVIASNASSKVKYKVYSDGTLSTGYTITNWANASAFQQSTTSGGGHTGTRAMRLPDTGESWGRGLSIRRTGTPAIDWSTVDAVSFWAKGDNVTISSFGLLDDAGSGGDAFNIEHKGTNKQGIVLTNTWTNYIIPLPVNRPKNQNISRQEVFKIWIVGNQNGKAVYIDDIELITATKDHAITIPASAANVSTGTVAISSLLGTYSAVYTVDGKTVPFYSDTVKFANWFDITYTPGGGATRNGDNLNVTGNFTLTVGFGGKTSNTLNATVATNVVTYRQHGAKGDGVTDDFGAIIAAHTAANTSGAMVRATAGDTYYIGGGNRTASIKTNTDWTGAKFIIDDTKVTKSSGLAWNDSWIFLVESKQGSISKTSSVTSLTKNQAKVNNLGLSSSAVIVAYDNNTKRYIRRGENANAGADQTDVFIVDKDGNVDQTAPIIWNFTRISNLVAYPIDAQTLTITGGEFTTKANTGNADDNYMKRGIRIIRSNTVIDGLKHNITGEGSQAAPYDAFLKFENCANVKVQNTTLTGHRGYPKPSQPQTTRGTYDINAARTVNLSFINCDQTNSITNGTYWGIFASNYSKNIVLDRVKFSRFDAHQGVRNVTILNSELGHQGVSTIGSGLLRIENTKVYGSNFIYFRDDYGSTWEGELRIINCTFQPPNLTSAQIIHTNNDGKWNFGYDCYMPETVTINGFTIVETNAPSNYNGVLLVSAVNTNTGGEPYPFRLTKNIYLSGYNSSKNYRMSNTYITNQIKVTRN